MTGIIERECTIRCDMFEEKLHNDLHVMNDVRTMALCCSRVCEHETNIS